MGRRRGGGNRREEEGGGGSWLINYNVILLNLVILFCSRSTDGQDKELMKTGINCSKI